MEKLSHAYIVSCASESAGLEKAYELAQTMLCSSGSERPCGVCRDCRKVKARIHPDLTLIERKTDDKGNLKKEITVDQVREMGADAYVLPNEAEQKVYIIRQADTMNAQAQNAALKLFEEPPEGVHFILCASNPERFLITVRSRCVQINCAGEEDSDSEEAHSLAREFFELAESGDTPGLTAWCFEHEKLSQAQLGEFLLALKRINVQALTSGGDARRIMESIELIDRCAAYQTVNTGVKHILGLLAVRSAAETRK